MNTTESTDFSNLIGTFRARAKTLRCSAIWVLILIIAVLLAGITVFIKAGDLANSESAKIFQRRIESINNAIEYNQKEITYLQREIEQEKSQANPGPLLEDFQTRLTEARGRDKSLRDSLHRVEQEGGDVVTDRSSQPYGILVSAIATRVGSIVLLLFLVRILAPLYRYNKRLSAYYDGRADALDLTRLSKASDRELFHKLTLSLSPDNIDFREGPSSPTEEVLGLLRQIFTSRQNQ